MEDSTKFINITSSGGGNNDNIDGSGNDRPTQMTGISFSFGSSSTSSSSSTTKNILLKRKEPEKKEPDNYITTLQGTKISTFLGDEPAKGPKVIPFQNQLNQNYEISTKSDDILNNVNQNNNNNNNNINNNMNENKKIKIELSNKISFYKPSATGLQLNPNRKQEIKSIVNSDNCVDEESLNNTNDNNKIPLILKLKGIEEFNNEDDKFKFDVESRPEESTEDDYNETPISIFGEAMLRGMGWEPGKSIGQSNKGLVEPIEYIKRPGYRLGLGAKPMNDDGPQLSMPEGPDGRVRHIKGIDEKLVQPKKMEEGSLVVVLNGPHQGMNAKVIKMSSSSSKVQIEFKSEERVWVEKSDLSLLEVYQPITDKSISSNSINSSTGSSSSLGSNLSVARNRNISNSDDSRSNNNNNNTKSNNDRLSSSTSSMSLSSSYSSMSNKSSTPTSSSLSSSTSSTSSSSASVMWIRPQILVKIISKSLGDGKYYNKRATVVDILGEKLCSVQLYNGVVLENVKQSMLETAIPKAKGSLIIVRGKYKDRIGTLVERRRNKKDIEMAIVQLVGDLSVLEFDLDDICEYVGNKDIDLYN